MRCACGPRPIGAVGTMNTRSRATHVVVLSARCVRTCTSPFIMCVCEDKNARRLERSSARSSKSLSPKLEKGAFSLLAKNIGCLTAKVRALRDGWVERHTLQSLITCIRSQQTKKTDVRLRPEMRPLRLFMAKGKSPAWKSCP